MPSDVASRMADDAIDAVNDKANRSESWSKTYDVNLFGQKYTATMMVDMNLLRVPLIGDKLRLGTEISVEVLGNSEEVLTHTFEYNTDKKQLADDIRQRIAMAHGKRMMKQDHEEYGYTLF